MAPKAKLSPKTTGVHDGDTTQTPPKPKSQQSTSRRFREAIENIDEYLTRTKNLRTKETGEYLEYSLSVLARYTAAMAPTLTRKDWSPFRQLVTSTKILYEINHPQGIQQRGETDVKKLFGSVGGGMIKMIDQRKVINHYHPGKPELVENIHKPITRRHSQVVSEVVENIEETDDNSEET